MDAVRQSIINKFAECYKISKGKGYDLPVIEVHFDLKGVCAGQFVKKTNFYSTYQYFRINLEMARHNTNTDFIDQTIPHEFSHYIVNATFGKVSAHHGREWQRIMLSVFGLVPSRCHNYDVSACRRKHSTMAFKCECKTHQITLRRAKVAMMGGYRCRACGGTLRPV